MTRTMEEVEKLLAELQADVEALKTAPADVWPKAGGCVWTLRSDGVIADVYWTGEPRQIRLLKRGNVFRTREEAEAEDKRRIILAGIHADAKADREKNEPVAGRVWIVTEKLKIRPTPCSHEWRPFGTPFFYTREAAEASAKKWLGGEE